MIGPRLMRVVGLVVLSLGGVLASPSMARPPGESGPQSIATCVFSADFTLRPGVTMTPSTFYFTTNGETATVYCTGEVNGSPVTGPGTYGEEGNIYGGNCFEGSGEGKYTAHIPTQAGVQRVKGGFKLQYVGLSGTETGPNIDATFEYFPTEGDCFNEPLTAFTLHQQETLRTP